jgi:hypothetical protein
MTSVSQLMFTTEAQRDFNIIIRRPFVFFSVPLW